MEMLVSPHVEDSHPVRSGGNAPHLYDSAINATWLDSGCKDWTYWTPTSWLTIPASARLVKKCIMNGSGPRDIAFHLQVAHNSRWDEAGPLAENVQ